MNKADSDFLCLQELHQRIKDDPENAGWYMHRAYKLGGGCSIDEALEFAPEKKKPVFSVVTCVDPGKPGGDMTATATFTREGGKLIFQSIEHSEPPCSFCFQRGCNGECHGDDMMGDS